MTFYLKLNGKLIKSPRSFDIEKYNLTKSGRVANGKMTMELVAKKRKFLFSYNVLSGKDLDDILEVIDSNNLFFNIEYVENDRVKTARVYVGEIKQTKFRSEMGWYWKDVTFNLIEQ